LYFCKFIEAAQIIVEGLDWEVGINLALTDILDVLMPGGGLCNGVLLIVFWRSLPCRCLFVTHGKQLTTEFKLIIQIGFNC
jgi:hypothetical protein